MPNQPSNPLENQLFTRLNYMKVLRWFVILLPLMIYAPVLAAADPFVIPQEIQKGVNPEKAIETLKNIFQFSPAPIELKRSPALEQNLQQIRSGTETFLKIDAGIRNLNAQIKATIGIDIPVLAGAIWNGIVWLIQWIYGLISKLAP
jgi:hypothetical protein